MPRLSPAALQKLLADLLAQRQQHVDAVAEIDAVFARYGITVGAPKRRGRKPGRKPGKSGRKPRGHFDQTADEFVLGLLKDRALTTREINVKWKEADRGGKPDNTLTKLVKSKRVKRTKVKGGQGSEYRAQ